jgi:hypothetical protein
VDPNSKIVNYTVTNTPGTLTITQEDARAYYTGSSLFFGSTTSATTATATLAATIKDITAVDPSLSAPNPDTFAGNITTARVTFVDRATNAPLVGCVDLVPALVSSADEKVGTVVCQTSLSISNSGGSPYQIGIIVGRTSSIGNYVRNNTDEDTTIVVAQPLTTAFITGGGYLLNPTNTAGQYAGDAGRKTNFGFNVKYNKSGTNLQGNVNIIVRKGAKVYQFKSNSLVSLAVQYCKADASGTTIAGSCAAAPTGSCTTNATAACPITATFQGKANMNDVSLPTAVSMGGNLTLQMKLTDRGEPGSTDSMAITITEGSTMLFSTKWDGTQTVEKVIDGGNLVAH